ncbi:MAG: EI24 domain-containing protein [Flavobacteriales bacterium]|nr:EI24 domain-containing protein [Flavobacteriales bacterium]
MSFTRDFGLGLSGFFRAFGFAMSNRMGWLFLVPVLLWVLLAIGLVAVLQGPVDRLSDWVALQLEVPVQEGAQDWWSDVKAFFNGAREVIVAILLKLAVAYLLFVANKYIVLILLSPLLAYASERTEEIITGRSFPFSWGQLMKDALRGALIALRNGIMELAITVGIWFLTLFVPVLAPVSFVLLFTVSAYFYGFSMFDYVFERRRMRIGESVKAVNDRIGAVLANGALFSLVMKLPLLGVMFAPVLASIGAVLATLKKEGGLPSLSQDSDRRWLDR